jgi:hypothetical protein
MPESAAAQVDFAQSIEKQQRTLDDRILEFPRATVVWPRPIPRGCAMTPSTMSAPPA